MECTLNKQMTTLPLSDDESFMEMGAGNYGCAHYRRRCKVRAPCCDEIFDCRHCHNDSKNALDVDPLRRHDLPRHDVKRVSFQCLGLKSFAHCVIPNRMFNKRASNVGFAWGSTFAQSATSSTMMFRRINTTVINVESAECCYSTSLKESHTCIERAMHHNCPVCFEYVFDTTKNVISLPCGHTMHLECVLQMEGYFQYSCPLCSRSYCDMSSIWEQLDQEVASTPMPEMYQNKMVWILCNDCAVTSEVNFHIVALKCPSCKSYNTKQIRGGNTSYANITEMRHFFRRVNHGKHQGVVEHSSLIISVQAYLGFQVYGL
ncbi:hypothetical protein BC332_22788 [Capsicum chinense]|nr:hypothetical protein BC332_22788 [Capsicum chinense]